MKTWFFLLLLSGTCMYLVSCSDHKAPVESFAEQEIPSPPDYTDLTFWTGHPDKKDFTDTVPEGDIPLEVIAPEKAKVDVFFIHPTTYIGGKKWNASLDDEKLNKQTDELAIKHQGSIFNEAGRIYAPRYRQMVLGGFYGEDKQSMMQAIDVAYGDVKRAFEYYLKNYNEGRPIMVASHSQGTVHGIRLIREFFDGTDLQDQLVSAYLVGWPFPQDTFAHIPVCEEPSQTGCVVGWCSWQKGKEPGPDFDGYYTNAVVVNPITWKRNDAYAPASLHEGFLGIGYKNIKTHKVDAQVHNGILWVSKPSPLILQANYHIGDLNLFWLDVRKNACKRASAFLKSNGKVEADTGKK